MMEITIDYRERNSGIIDLLTAEDISVEVRKLHFGDYIINHSITVERKTARDFLISIIDARLFNQLSSLKKNCEKPVLLIEGNPYKTDLDIDPNAVKGALISIKTIWYVPVIFSTSIKDTIDTLILMGRQDEKNEDVVPLRGGYRPKRLKNRQLYILQGLPKVGPAIATRLLNHFRSVSRIINATEEELMEVEGIGKSSARKIREVLE
jgi:DNA excision repair protein ERCC-4